MTLCIFLLTAFILAYTFFLYPALLFFLAHFFSKPVAKNYDFTPRVSVVLAARNVEKQIQARLQNLLASDYPRDQLEIIFVSDGSSDATPEQARSLHLPEIQVIENKINAGKAACINQAITHASGEVIVFTDSRQSFPTNALKELVANFADPNVGAASGDLSIASVHEAAADGLGIYWRLEKAIRFAESRLDSAVGCTGALYAMRRTCIATIPDDTILDDVLLPMQAALAGFRVLFDPAAQAFDPLPQRPEVETGRKERTIAGNFQLLFRHPSWLLPWKNRLCRQLVSHKYLRLFSPLLLLALFALNLALLPSAWAQLLLGLQILAYCLGIIGLLLPRKHFRLLAAPAAFLFLNVMTIRGFWRYLQGRYSKGWETTVA